MTINPNEQQLQLLAIFHYIVGGVMALFSCFPAVYLIIGIIMIVAPENMQSNTQNPPPEFLGWMLAIMGASFILTGWTFAACTVIAGLKLAKHKHYTFCLVIACLLCLFIPFGTILGIFTIIALNRDSVKEIFKTRKIILTTNPGTTKTLDTTTT